jgi:hypothetical protein
LKYNKMIKDVILSLTGIKTSTTIERKKILFAIQEFVNHPLIGLNYDHIKSIYLDRDVLSIDKIFEDLKARRHSNLSYCQTLDTLRNAMLNLELNPPRSITDVNKSILSKLSLIPEQEITEDKIRRSMLEAGKVLKGLIGELNLSQVTNSFEARVNPLLALLRSSDSLSDNRARLYSWYQFFLASELLKFEQSKNEALDSRAKIESVLNGIFYTGDTEGLVIPSSFVCVNSELPPFIKKEEVFEQQGLKYRFLRTTNESGKEVLGNIVYDEGDDALNGEDYFVRFVKVNDTELVPLKVDSRAKERTPLVAKIWKDNLSEPNAIKDFLGWRIVLPVQVINGFRSNEYLFNVISRIEVELDGKFEYSIDNAKNNILERKDKDPEYRRIKYNITIYGEWISKLIKGKSTKTYHKYTNPITIEVQAQDGESFEENNDGPRSHEGYEDKRYNFLEYQLDPNSQPDKRNYGNNTPLTKPKT